MKPLRCGTGVPAGRLDPADRRHVEDFRRYLAGDLALAADGLTYVDPDDPQAVHFARRKPAEGGA